MFKIKKQDLFLILINVILFLYYFYPTNEIELKPALPIISIIGISLIYFFNIKKDTSEKKENIKTIDFTLGCTYIIFSISVYGFVLNQNIKFDFIIPIIYSITMLIYGLFLVIKNQDFYNFQVNKNS